MFYISESLDYFMYSHDTHHTLGIEFNSVQYTALAITCYPQNPTYLWNEVKNHLPPDLPDYQRAFPYSCH